MSNAAAEFVFLGEHPALDFANTLYAPHGELADQLRSWPDLLKWLGEANLGEGPALEVSKAEANTALAAVLALRAAWTKQITGILAAKPISKDFLRTLNAALEKDHFTEAVAPAAETPLALVRADSRLRGVERVLAILARQIAAFLTECNHDYLRQCAGHGCVLFFYDTTKNHRRQWCSAAACGNRHKVAAFRERQAKKDG
ncbi:CGNR zinc finger domain-containing protein [Luteolibacter sp. Populi]|uniref:CGNR zinc finger domain-containing protein n=1 Tax=Luteolibacter sp. Populi TaxID=3230487 RepID=UPI0034661214